MRCAIGSSTLTLHQLLPNLQQLLWISDSHKSLGIEEAIHPYSAEEDPPEHPPPSPPQKTPGGWKSVKYILAHESFEKSASTSSIANLTVYLRTKYNMDAGAFVSDAYLGRFHTLLLGSMVSFLGMGTMNLTAGVTEEQVASGPAALPLGQINLIPQLKKEEHNSKASSIGGTSHSSLLSCCWSKHRASLDCEHTFYDPPSNKAGPWTSSLLVPIGLSTLIRQLSVLTQVNWTLMVRPRMVGAYVVWIEQVEELKCLLAIFPVWISGVTCFVVMDQHNTFGILQAIQTNRSIGRFEIPLDWLRLQQRIAIGILMPILCMLLAGIGEGRRRHSALRDGSFTLPTSVAILLPQFILSGLTEAFAAVAVMEYFTTQMPDSMRTVAGAIFHLSLSITSYLSSLLVNVIHANYWEPWLVPMGMGTMTLTAGVTEVRPFPCNGQRNCPQPYAWQLVLLYGVLGLLAIGAGGIRTCSIAFGADQFDPTTEKGRAQLQSFFDWWYFSFILALVVASVLWSTFRPMSAGLLDMVKVVAAPGSKLDCENTFYDPPSNKAGPWTSKLARTNRFKHLDKATLSVDPSELDTHGVTCFVVMDQHNTFGILQAIQTNRSIGRFEGLRLTLQQRIAIGILVPILCMLSAGIGDGRRRHSALRDGSFTLPVSVAILLPQGSLPPQSIHHKLSKLLTCDVIHAITGSRGWSPCHYVFGSTVCKKRREVQLKNSMPNPEKQSNCELKDEAKTLEIITIGNDNIECQPISRFCHQRHGT
ncbi:Protein NRT1/ PTR family 2.8 [Vitis vinifera]|uniref:Protein NRT1/ PTR family 2.8 n=1 Tax=Vitis vinifera TaxID=29760 RepID=A0A438I3E5_VITVI|nr:Protein NRT1/ PTR family 2.8 [Vitis vinifera]